MDTTNLIDKKKLPCTKGSWLARFLLQRPSEAIFGIPGWVVFALTLLLVAAAAGLILHNCAYSLLIVLLVTIGRVVIWFVKLFEPNFSKLIQMRWKKLPIDWGNWFPRALEKIKNSPNILERAHILIGVVWGTTLPILLHVPLLLKNVVFVGPPGSFKSTMMRYLKAWLMWIADIVFPHGLVIVTADCNGSHEDAVNNRAEAEAAGFDFIWLTTETGLSSFIYNPLDQSHHDGRTVNEVIQVLLSGMGLTSGQDGGEKQFWDDRNQQVAGRAMEKMPHLKSFAELARALDQPGAWNDIGLPLREFEQGSHTRAVLDGLKRVSAINGTPKDREHAIDILAILSKPRKLFIHCSLPLSIEPTTNRVITRTLAFQFAAVKRMLARRGKKSPFVLFSIDDGIDTLIPPLSTMLRTTRASGMSVWWSIHSLLDLKTRHHDYTGDVMNNADCKFYFSVRDPEGLKHLEKTGGTEKVERISVDSNGREVKTPVDEPRFNSATIEALNNDPHLVAIEANPGSGFSRWNHSFLGWTPLFHISKEEFERRCALTWPEGNEHTVINGQQPPPPPPPLAIPVTQPGPKPQPKPKAAAQPKSLPPKLDGPAWQRLLDPKNQHEGT